MTLAAITCIFFFLCSPFAGAAEQKVTINPVTRVVELLQALSKKVEKEGKVEEGLYEDFVCWGKSVISERIASNSEAESRIAELKTYIADFEAGRIDLTSERTDLEKEIAELMADMETARAIRNKEHEDYMEAIDEIEEAMKALDGASETLGQVVQEHKEGVLLAVRARLKGAAANGGMAALTQRQASLRKAVDLGERFLEKADAKFLQRVLLGEVPNRGDAKKLNRKAVFKMKYKARSTKILDTLQKMKDTFGRSGTAASEKEDEADKAYKALTSAKQKQLDAARAALSNQDAENGAKSMALAESTQEKEELTTQVGADQDLILRTREALAEKAASWKTRSDLRAGELAAISKAIYILHNDDSRDLFKKSYNSHALFLQVQRTSNKALMNRHVKAAVALKDAALLSGDEDARQRLLALAAGLPKSVAGLGRINGIGGSKIEDNHNFEHFDPVINSIDVMIDNLLKEENKDLETKQICEKDRQDATAEAIQRSRRIDEMTDVITQEQTNIQDAEQKITELESEITKTEDEYQEARERLNREERAWKEADKDDEAAAATVKRARDVLEQYYLENFQSFVQKSKGAASLPGRAIPPPATWEGGYGGKTGESQGIVAILEMVHEDILKDKNDAEQDYKNSALEFRRFVDDNDARKTTLSTEKEHTEAALGRAMKENSTQTELRADEKKLVNGILKTIEGVNPNCEYYEANYPMRVKNRQIERDGLNKAKAILMGGVFDQGPDPDREMKPGDAASAALFLQKHA